MKVFVKNQNNELLMPTTPRKARILLKEDKVHYILPFLFQNYKQYIYISSIPY